MEELALHILDLAQNSIAAGASEIVITIVEAHAENSLRITLADNGRGMERETLEAVSDPFFTTRTTRRVGLGIPLLKAAAELCEGSMTVESVLGQGTTVEVYFRHDHIDRVPLGDMAATVAAIMAVNPHIEVLYRHTVDSREFTFDSREVRAVCEDLSQHPKIIEWLQGYIAEHERALGGEQ
ncbi:MAG: ATP-binding protein [Firmicutes bacterium]|nr:ATP-binding protein [Dethiobacter sp.]MBS3888934.1 ATP-binding protein [Bacillota bacterium]MBS4053554.1 ATP-binding protein [Thermaerobacter sp.]